MIGTEEGFWFALKTGPGGAVEYEFYEFNDQIETGTAPNEEEMYRRFDAAQLRRTTNREAQKLHPNCNHLPKKAALDDWIGCTRCGQWLGRMH